MLRRAQLCASDDGQWLAALQDFGTNTIAIHDSTGQVTYRQKLDEYVSRMSFEPKGARLAIDTTNAVTVLEREGDRFVAHQLEDAWWSSFAGGALFFGSSKGIERWDGTHRSTVFAKTETLETANRFDRPWWLLTPDGAHLAIWSQTQVMVVALATGAVLLNQTREYHTEPPVVCDATSAPNRIWLYLCDGDLLGVELDTGRRLSEGNFGSVGHWSRNLLMPNSTWVPHLDSWGLAGRYLRVTRDGVHIFYRTPAASP